MGHSDHTCEECPHWDDINGCWRGRKTRGPQDIACPDYDGDDEEDGYDDGLIFEERPC